MFEKVKELFRPQDMTKGSPTKGILLFSIPLLIGNFAQQLYSTVDSVIVGQYVGDAALSAIGTTLPIINLLLVLFMAIATGSGIMVAQYFGARAKNDLAKTIGNSITLIVIATLGIMAVGIAFSGTFLEMTNTPEETFDMAYDYLIISMIGALGSALYNIVSGILRGLGISVFPLLILLLTAGMNTVLDLWFIAGLDMGVAGAAWATIISQAISAVILIWKLAKMRHELVLSASSFKLTKKYALGVMKLGLPAGVSQAIMSLAMVFVQSLTNSMGYIIVTTTTAVMRIDGFAMLPNFTFGMAISTYVGQNVGAGDFDRVKKGSRACMKITMIASVTLVLLLLFFSPYMLQLFTTNPTIISLGTTQIRILAAGYIAMGLYQVFVGIMRGAGDTMPAMWISFLTTVVFRTPLAYLLAYFTRSDEYPNGNPIALFVSLLVSWVMGAVISGIWYKVGKWKEKAIIKRDVKQQEAMAE
ncbi:MAG: MATE family efflux transporter [Clostridia bacterium]|nr:MATE family efflux transporter [Clostridia bacterium]